MARFLTTHFICREADELAQAAGEQDSRRASFLLCWGPLPSAKRSTSRGWVLFSAGVMTPVSQMRILRLTPVQVTVPMSPRV